MQNLQKQKRKIFTDREWNLKRKLMSHNVAAYEKMFGEVEEA